MRPECVKYLHDMLDAAEAIDDSTRGLTVEAYLQQRTVRDAVQWNFCVIGEALAQLKKIDESAAAQITEHQKIIGFRNQLIHGYGVINHEISWNIITSKLPLLLIELRRLK